MARGHSVSIYLRFSGKERTSLYISREKGDHYYIQTQYNDHSFPITIIIFLGKHKEKFGPKRTHEY